MASIMDHFGNIPDPRLDRKKLHKLQDIIFITISAVVCGCDTWEDIEEWGEIREDWLGAILELPNGIPSHDTINRVFSLIDPKAFQQCFVDWVKSVSEVTEGQIISIDGKRLCNSGEDGAKAIIHMVSAWSNANNMVLAQQKIDDKSNEITAIPALLDMLHIKGCLITIDAMGCQKAIAKAITDKGADYILAVKENQGHLLDDIKEAFGSQKTIPQHSQMNLGHGRIEKRTCSIITDTDWVCDKKEWEQLHMLIRIESERIIKATGVMEKQVRYYISSKVADAETFNNAIREHWGIENKLHWTLDVAFGEDKSNKRAGHAAENFSFISKIALNLLKQHNDFRGVKRISIRTRRKKSSWSKDYLMAVLAGIDKF
jgi:predicted transposase YbfD/YdcC